MKRLVVQNYPSPHEAFLKVLDFSELSVITVN